MTGPPFTIRRWTPTDIAFLWETLYRSLHVPEGSSPFSRSVLDEPPIAHYLARFGQLDGDDAVVAVDADGRPVGAAFCRHFAPSDPGYGFVDEQTPELSIAVDAAWRGRGVGRSLLARLLLTHPRMSLSVDATNGSAIGLYRTLGFAEVGIDGGSVTMLRAG